MKPYNPIDELFASKLREKQTPPPPALWDKLEEQLPGQAKKPFAYWYYAAASVLLLVLALAGGLAGYQYRSEELAATTPQETSVPHQQKAIDSSPLAGNTPAVVHEPLEEEPESQANEATPAIAVPHNANKAPKAVNKTVAPKPSKAAPLLAQQVEEKPTQPQPKVTEKKLAVQEAPQLAAIIPAPAMQATQQPEPTTTIVVEIRSGAAPTAPEELLAMANDNGMNAQDQPHKKVGRFIKKLNDLRNGEEEEVEEFRQMKDNLIGQLLNKTDKK